MSATLVVLNVLCFLRVYFRLLYALLYFIVTVKSSITSISALVLPFRRFKMFVCLCH